MKRTFGRVLAASAGALALVGMGISAASAAETTNPNFQGSFTVADANTAEPVTGTIGFEQQVVGLLDASDFMVKFPVPATATQGWVFVSPRGQESTVSAWNAKAGVDLAPGDILLPNVSLTGLTVAGGGAPNGINAVKSVGGDYSLGLAFTLNNGVTYVPNSTYFGHIHVTAGSGDWTFEQATVSAAATTTTVSAPASASEGANVAISATVAPAAATGTVQFKDGGVNIGAPVALSGGSASTTISGITAGSHAITAVYSGGAGYSASTSAAVTISVAGAPVSTTLAVVATSATGKANQPVDLTATVAPAAATGAVAFTASVSGGSSVALGTVPVSGGTAHLTTSALPAGAWTVTAAFAGTGVYQASTATATVSLEPNAGAADPDPQTVRVTVPAGSLTITTPWTAASPLDLGELTLNQADSTFELAAPKEFASATDIAKGIKIVNARPDAPHFTAQVAATDFTSASGSFAAGKASLVGLTKVAVPGNALDVANLGVTSSVTLSNAAQTFAQYTGAQLGTAWIAGNIDIAGVPTSTPSGVYTATVTFTAF